MSQQEQPEVTGTPQLTTFEGKHPDSFVPNRISEEEANSKDFILATDINNLATLIVGWHTHACNQGQHVLNIDNLNPADGQMIQISVYEPEHPNADDKGFRNLSADELIPFKHGVRYLLDQFESLPFQYAPTDADGETLPGYGSDNAEQTDAENSGA